MNRKSPTKIVIDNQGNEVTLHSEVNTSTANQVKKGQFIYSFQSTLKYDECRYVSYHFYSNWRIYSVLQDLFKTVQQGL